MFWLTITGITIVLGTVLTVICVVTDNKNRLGILEWAVGAFVGTFVTVMLSAMLLRDFGWIVPPT